jgi:predicted RNA-binding Zn-ribbon protein involved in translation (DUF1610 family)
VSIQVTCSSCKSQFNAPDNSGGKRTKCPKCGGIIQIPMAGAAPAMKPAAMQPAKPAPKDDIFDAIEEPARTPFSDEDFEIEHPAEKKVVADDRKPCPMCGEMIQKDAVKCRYCGEIFDPILKKQQKKASKSAAAGGEDMTTGDWVVAVLCSFIGVIAGIIWLIQGKPKGGKMLGVSFLFMVLWNVLRFVASTAVQPHR